MLRVFLSAWTLVMGMGLASAVPAGSPAPSNRSAMDTVQIHDLYVEGDFDKATSLLEEALRGNQVRTHGDSILAFKHLGVMYAASEHSREKGKYYMLQLVTMEPTARIMDMYASDMIYMIFKNIQEEYELTRGKVTRARGHVEVNRAPAAEPSGVTAPPAAPPSPPAAASKPASHPTRNYLLAGAAAALVGAGVVTYHVLAEVPESGIIRYEIDR